MWGRKKSKTREYAVSVTYQAPDINAPWIEEFLPKTLEFFLETGILDKQIQKMIDIPLEQARTSYEIGYPLLQDEEHFFLDLNRTQEERTFNIAIYGLEAINYRLTGSISW